MGLYESGGHQEKIAVLEKLIALSVDLHNLNAGVQRQWDLSIVQWLVLRKIIEQPGLSAGTLAENSKVHPSTLTPTIGRLEGMGLIYVLERPSDLRRKLLVASWKGLEWSRKSESALTKAFDGAMDERERLPIDVDSIRDLTSNMIKNIVHSREVGKRDFPSSIKKRR
jgi:DNA-binding MarR family transcriptional regulator